jgi:hypothetical protein
MTAKAARGADAAGDRSPGMRLNRRMKDILATGLLPSMSPSSLTVLTYAGAYGDFTACTVFLGAKTVAGAAFNGRQNRNSVRRGIDELLDVGFLVTVKDRTFRKATVYRLALVPERVAAAKARVAAVGAKRRRSREGGHGCAPRGVMDVPPGGSSVCPQGGHGCAPNLSLNVPSSLKERYASSRSARRSLGRAAGEHDRRLRKAAVNRRAKA